jgi:predicted AAA+ superfamily ATPase
MTSSFQRALVSTLVERIKEPRHFMQVVIGPRQTGKTTALRQALDLVSLPFHYASADDTVTQSRAWLQAQWDFARRLCHENGTALLVIDEIQHIHQWSSLVKALWDEDSWNKFNLRVVITGSSSLLLQTGLTESLTGRFELLRCPHWTYAECQAAFGYTLDDYLYYGGYPGSAVLRDDQQRWLDYLNNTIIEPSLSKDVIALESIQKPALMRSLFLLGTQYSVQELSFRKMLGQLDDVGNATTIAHYLELLARAELLCGLQKYTGKELTTRASSPRLMAFDTSLLVAVNRSQSETLMTDPNLKGHLVETAVGAHLLKRAKQDGFAVYWWRDGNQEVDFVLKKQQRLTALEVKSGRIKSRQGLTACMTRFPVTKQLVVGSAAVSLENFLLDKVDLF